MNKKQLSGDKRIQQLYEKVVAHIASAHKGIIRSVDTEQIRAYWLIGRDIVEEEQTGMERAEYGKSLLQQLSRKLTKKFGTGFSVSSLTHMRRFYFAYQLNQKSYALRTKSQTPKFKPKALRKNNFDNWHPD